MQKNSNLVIYNKKSIWASNINIYNHDNCQLVIQNDENLVIYDSKPHPIWAIQMVITYKLVFDFEKGYFYIINSDYNITFQ